MATSLLIPGRLSLAKVGGRVQPPKVNLSLSDIAAPEFRGGQYQVCHYPRSLSGTHGPPALDQILIFAHELHCRLEEEASHVVVEYAEGQREFVAVLVGAFLVLSRGWSVSQVCSRMREESRLVFPCSWERRGCMRVQACWEGLQTAHELGWVSPTMVEDEEACRRAAAQFWNTIVQYDGSWLAPGKIFVMADPTTVVLDPNPGTCPAMFPETAEAAKEDDASSTVASTHTCEAAIIPVAIDCDAVGHGSYMHPVVEQRSRSSSGESAFTQQSRSGTKESARKASQQQSPRDIGHGSYIHPVVEQRSRSASGESALTQQSRSGTKESASKASQQQSRRGTMESVCKDFTQHSRRGSTESVCKDFTQHSRRASTESVCKPYAQTAGRVGKGSGGCQHQPLPLLTFFKEQGITSMVRANMIHEPGLTELGGSYNARLLEPYGLRHADVPVKDTDGSVPDDGDIRIFLDAVSQMGMTDPRIGAGQALVIHCKSGFGRSVVFACILLIYLHDVSGRALMGWSRIVRPGAVISPQEENLLLKLSGRAALLQYCGASHLQEADGAATQACGCSVQ